MVTARPYQWAQLKCNLKISFTNVLHLAMITHDTSLQVHLAFLITFDKLRLYVFWILVFRQNSCLITFHNKSFLHIKLPILIGPQLFKGRI